MAAAEQSLARNVLLVLHSHKCGGAEKHLLYLALELRNQGFGVHVACPADSWLAEQVLATGLSHCHLAMHGFYDLWSLWRLVRYVRREGIDLLHGHLMRGAHYAGWAGRLCRRPTLATAHSTNTWKHLRRHPRIIAVSNAVRTALIEKGLAADRIVVIENGIPVPVSGTPSARDTLRRELGLSEHSVAIVNVARFVRDKGQDVLVRALHQASSAGSLPLQLFLVGDCSGAWYGEISRLVNELHLEKQVTFLGHREDVAQLLPAMDLFVLPSRREALSLAILEAFAADLPVIASATGGIPELVQEGVTGRLCPVDDVPQLATLLLDVAGDAAQRRRLTATARTTFLQAFTAEVMTRRIAAEYRTLCDAPGQP